MSLLPPRPDLPRSDPPRPDLPPADEIPRATWAWYEALGVYLITFIVAGVVAVSMLDALGGSPTQSTSGGIGPPEIGASIAGDLVTLGLLVFWLRRWHPQWRRIIRLPERARLAGDVRFGVIAGLILYPAVAFGVGVVLTLLFQALFGEDVHTPEQIAGDLGVWGSIGAVILAVVVAPVTEELFFRGILFRTLRDRHGFWPGAILSALLFGTVHYVPDQWQSSVLLQTTMVFTGLGLAWIYERRGSLVANIAAHTAFNVIGIVLILVVG